MRTYHRNYIFESNDFDLLCKFIIQENAAKKDSFIWHLGRIVDWKFNIFNAKKHIPDNFAHETHLWFNYYHELIGFVLSEDFNEDYTIFVKENYSFLYQEMLCWAKENWGNRYSKLRTCVMEKQTELIKILEQEGYIRNDGIEMTRVFDTSHYKDYEMEDINVTLQNMSEYRNYTEHHALRRNAWPVNIEKEMDQLIAAYIRRSPIYNADYDYVLVNKEGRCVSGCEAFVDYENGTAEIERVCTHSDFYNKGYAQMALKSCMRRLYENNIAMAFITGGYDKTLYLYGKLGHVSEIKRSFYEVETGMGKDLGE